MTLGYPLAKEVTMANALAAPRRMTADEFLDFSGDPETRYELLDGEIIAMTAPKDAHGSIVGCCWCEIDRRLEGRPPCQGVVEAGIRLDDHNHFQADVAATYAPPTGERWVHEPFLIVEVILESSEDHDLGRKTQRYMTLASVQELWLIDSRERWAQTWRRAGEVWIVSLPLRGSAAFAGEAMGGEIQLDRLYRNTAL